MAGQDASLAVENFAQQLKQEAGALEKVHKMNSLRSELRSVSLLLREFNEQENEPKVEEQLQKVRDIAYEAQDEIESIVQETERHERKGKLGKMFSRKNTIKHHLETIEGIEKRLQSIHSFKDVVGSTEVPEFRPIVGPPTISQSWQLLTDQVFGRGNSCAPNLEELGKRMADTCRGSPWAIMTLAKILNQAEKTEETWKEFLIDLDKGQIWENEDLLKDPRFLYLGLFPSKFDILAKQIIQMWTAEGLLQHKGNIVAEKNGEEYLKELSKRSLIQQSTTKMGDDASVKTYRISSFISNLCRKIGENKLSLQVTDDRNAEHGVGAQIVRLGMPNTAIQVLQSCNRARHLHSLYSFGECIESNSSSLWKTLHNKFPSLRVLNMGSLKLQRVPKEIGKLIHLRYLRLVAPGVRHLPSSFGNLRNLETLDMRETHLRGQLHGIWKMKRIRHVYLGHFSMPDPNSIDYYKVLQNLQTLSGVNPDRILKRLMVRAKFPNIKRLRLCSLDQEGAFSFLNSLDHLNYLRSLRIEKTTKIPDDPKAFPLSLSKITLMETCLKPTCIEKLERLPNLKVLKLLKDSIIGEEIACTAEGFPQLEVLYLDGLDLEKLTPSEGMMPHLKHFYIKECSKLTIPEALEEKVVKL